MSITIEPPQPLPSRLRLMFRANQLLQTLRLLPSAEKLGALPKAKRSAMKPAGFMVPAPTGAVEVSAARAGDVPLRLYTPAEPLSGTAVLFIHGGGFTVGGLDSLDWFCRQLAVDTGSFIASVDYRLSPDDVFPAALDDCAEALAWLSKEAANRGLSRIVVAGDSAGGNLSAAVCLRNAEADGPRVDGQILIYPGLDCTLSSPTMDEVGPGLTKHDLKISVANYLGDGDPRDPHASPMLADDLGIVPPAFILTAEHDVLRDDGNRYAERLIAAGVPTRLHQYSGAPHGFFSLQKLVPSARRAYADVVGYVRAASAPESSGG